MVSNRRKLCFKRIITLTEKALQCQVPVAERLAPLPCERKIWDSFEVWVGIDSFAFVCSGKREEVIFIDDVMIFLHLRNRVPFSLYTYVLIKELLF